MKFYLHYKNSKWTLVSCPLDKYMLHIWHAFFYYLYFVICDIFSTFVGSNIRRRVASPHHPSLFFCFLLSHSQNTLSSFPLRYKILTICLLSLIFLCFHSKCAISGESAQPSPVAIDHETDTKHNEHRQTHMRTSTRRRRPNVSVVVSTCICMPMGGGGR